MRQVVGRQYVHDLFHFLRPRLYWFLDRSQPRRASVRPPSGRPDQVFWPPPFSFRGRQRSGFWPPPFGISWPPTPVRRKGAAVAAARHLSPRVAEALHSGTEAVQTAAARVSVSVHTHTRAGPDSEPERLMYSIVGSLRGLRECPPLWPDPSVHALQQPPILQPRQ
jgi:hypothetical protein